MTPQKANILKIRKQKNLSQRKLSVYICKAKKYSGTPPEAHQGPKRLKLNTKRQKSKQSQIEIFFYKMKDISLHEQTQKAYFESYSNPKKAQ